MRSAQRAQWWISHVLQVALLMLFLRCAEGRKYFKTFAGPYWAVGKRVHNCQPSEVKDPWLNVTVRFLNMPRVPNEAQRMSASLNSLHDITDAALISIGFDTWSNNQWKSNSLAKLQFPDGACSTLRRYFPDFTRKVFGLDSSSNEPCVLPAGERSVENVPMNWTIPKFPNFYYGDHRGHVYGHYNKVQVFCTVVEIKVMPLSV